MTARLNIGPFGESIEAIEKFGTNVYMNYLYGQTIEQLLEAERELDIAKKLESTESEIKMIEEKIMFLESIVSLATKNYQNSQDDVSATDKTK